MFSWSLSQNMTYLLTMLLPLALQIAGLSYAVCVDDYLGKKQKWVFAAILVLVSALIAQNYLDLRFSKDPHGVLARTITAIVGYGLRPMILLLFCYLVEPEKRLWPGWLLVGVNTALYLTALFSKLVFHISDDNRFQRGPLSYTCLIVSLLLLAWLLLLTVRKCRKTPARGIWLPLLIVPIILLGIWLDGRVGHSEQPVSFLTVSIVTSCVLYYLWLHLQLVLAREQELKERRRMQLTLSQIKPHFLYNALGAIEGLCDSDPQAAKAATVKFSKYLRSNLAVLTEHSTVPFSQELAHTKLYLELEQTRFEDALQVVYDISCTDFFLPPLSLEPLVENAVRHGVRMNPDGRGTVTISTGERPEGIELSVRDDGPGFDPSLPPSDGKTHVGIQNVRARLEACGGRLEIISKPGAGATAVIVIPRDKGKGIREKGKEGKGGCNGKQL